MKPSKVVVSRTAHTVLRHLAPKTKNSIRTALDRLRTDPQAGKPLTQELDGLWSLPVGRYRIIYRIDARRTTTIVYIGPRRDVYETLRELLSE